MARNSLYARFQNEVARNALLSKMDPRDTANALMTAPSEGAAQFGANFLPIVGDAVGAAQDASMYYTDPSSRRIGNYLLSGLGLLPMVPAANSLMRKAPLDDAAEVARRNAVKMLGLPENNTAMDRAAALGYTTPAYHGTVGDVAQFNPEYRGIVTNAPSAKKADFAASSPLVASGYALAPEGRTAIELQRQIAAAEAARDWPTFERLTEELENSVYGNRSAVNALSDARFQADQAYSDVLKKYGIAQDYYSFRPEYGDHSELGAFEAKRRMRESSYKSALEKLPRIKDEKALIKQMEDVAGMPFAGGWNTADDVSNFLAVLRERNPGLADVFDSMINGNFDNPVQPDALKELDEAYRKIRGIDAEWLASDVPEGANVMPLLVDTSGFDVKDFKGAHYRDESYNDLIKKAAKNRKAGVVLKNTHDPGRREMSEMTDVFAIRDPSKVRSKFAVFDPARVRENDLMGFADPTLLAAIGLGTAGGIGAWTANEKRKAKE